MANELDRLTGQLDHLPSIVARLAMSIANAKKELDADYLRNLERLMNIAQKTIGPPADGSTAADRIGAMLTLLTALAPSRYQFTETTIDFSADLSERRETSMAVKVGIGTPAVTISAAYAQAFGYDYRAAARITVKLHALPSSAELLGTLLTRAAAIDDKTLPLPPATELDTELLTRSQQIFAALPAPSPAPKP